MSNPWNPMPSAPTTNFFAKPASAAAVATPSFLSYPYGSGGATSASASNANLVGGFNNFANPRMTAGGTSNGVATGTNYYNSRPLNNGLAPPSTNRPPPVNNDITSFAIGTFNANNVNGDDSAPAHNSFLRDAPPTVGHFGSSVSPNNLNTRETGIIEKLLHSYGFIQCCERQARLFFHFSQFDGNIEHLKIGDPVEFEVTYDKRNGKPIASVVSKIAPEVVLSEERVTGTVTTELNPATGQNQGRISYENRGECFFLPYNKDDVEGNVTLRTGDKVSFQIATNQSRSGNLAARYIRLEDPAQPVRYQGVVCSLKDSFGFIERGDVVREIFFHFSEAKGLPDDLQLGDDVEFSIQTRNGKEVAVQITRLPPGSVIFEDVSSEITKGQVLKPLEKHIPGSPSNANADPLSGRLRYRGKDRSEVEIPFGDKDQKGDYTLRHGDWVQFNVAVDRRDKLQRATNIELLEESFAVSGEKREMGVICSLKDGFGFIRCADREARLFFHFSELLDPEQEIGLGTEVEFTTVQDQTPPSKQSAIRIRTLSTGTVQFEVITQRNMVGTVTREPANSWTHRSPSKLNGEKHGDELGLVSFIQNNTTEHIPFHPRECDIRNCPRLGDEVEFDLAQIKRNKEFMALNLRVINKASTSSGSNKKSEDAVENEENKKARKVSGDGIVCRGYIAALKESFGFVETEAHDREIFFHYSHVDGNVDDLDLGMEVEYTVTTKGQPQGKLSAENVRILHKSSLPKGKVQDTLLEGVIVRPLRAVNQDATGYPGIVRQGQDVDGDSPTYEFGITSLENKREFLQKGDAVYFKLEEYPDQENKTARATAIRPIRQTLKAQVDAVKGQYGFLNYEVEEGKKLFFHVSEVKDHVSLQPGDTVEFIILSNHRTGKSSAVNVVKVESQAPAPRPERLQVRLRAMSMDDGPRLIVIRQPRGPDGTRGFKKAKEQI